MIVVSTVAATHHNSPLLTQLSNSFSIDIEVAKDDLDGFGHVNNARYIQWLDQCHWAHLAHCGISSKAIYSENCGFVVHHTEVTYCAPLYQGNHLRVGSEITTFDGSFRLSRKFQLVCIENATTVLHGTIDYISVDLTTGKPRRLPKDFAQALY